MSQLFDKNWWKESLLLNELEIQPNIDDPIKRKNLKVGDKIEWINYRGEKETDTIEQIFYYVNYNDVVSSWKEADEVQLVLKDNLSSLFYYKNPISDREEGQYEYNDEFDSIQKIDSIQELEIQPNIPVIPLKRDITNPIYKAASYTTENGHYNIGTITWDDFFSNWIISNYYNPTDNTENTHIEDYYDSSTPSRKKKKEQMYKLLNKYKGKIFDVIDDSYAFYINPNQTITFSNGRDLDNGDYVNSLKYFILKKNNELNELEIQPNIPDPIKRKGLHIGDKIEWKNYRNIIKKSELEGIRYWKASNNEYDGYILVFSWREADIVEIQVELYYNGLMYFKNPQNEEEELFNKEFDSIQKINPINELEIRPNIPDPIKRKDLKVGDEIEWKNNGNETARKDTIQKILYVKYDEKDKAYAVATWQEADYIIIRTSRYQSDLIYLKEPQVAKYDWNKEFETIQKITNEMNLGKHIVEEFLREAEKDLESQKEDIIFNAGDALKNELDEGIEIGEKERIGKGSINALTRNNADKEKLHVFIQYLNKLVDYVCKDLQIVRPSIRIINSSNYTQQNHSFGGFSPNNKEIYLVIKNRNLRDSCTTLAHELRHFWQNQNNLLTPESGKDGDKWENDANAYSGKIMRKFARENPEIFLMFND